MDFTALYVLTAAAVLVASASAAAATGQCRGSKAEMDVQMETNRTGFWSASVRLHQRSALGSRSPPPVAVRAEPSVSVCGNVRTDTLLVTLEMPPPLPLPGYTYFPGVGSYKLHTTKSTWAEAKVACEKEGAHLVIINSEEEAGAMRELMKRHTGLAVWLFVGFSDQAVEGSYVTIFGEPLASTGYLKWNKGQPDDYGGREDCGSIYQTALLNDLTCNNKVEFICEQWHV